MNGEPHPQYDLKAAGAEVLAQDGVMLLFRELEKSAAANEQPFRLTRTQRWAAVGGCIVLIAYGVNVAIESDNTPQPLSGYTIPDSSPSPEASQSDPPSYLKGAPYGGKGGAPKFDHLPE